MINKILNHVNLHPSNLNARTFLIICLSIFIMGTVSMWSTSYHANNIISTYEKKVASKDPEFMQTLLSRCQGDLYNPQVVQSCLDLNYEDNTKEHKKTVWVQRLKLTLWFLFWSSIFVSYYLLLRKQSGYDIIKIYKDAFAKRK